MRRSTSKTTRSPARRSRTLLVAALAAAALCAAASVLGSCHAFSDLAPPDHDAGNDASTLDALSADGAEAGPGADLPGLLSLTEALQLCSKVLTCPHVGPSISASFGLPVDFSNYSQCVHTLSGPIDPRRINAVIVERLRCAVAASGCAVGGCVVAEEIDVADPRIDPACADGGAVEKCAGQTAITCIQSALRGSGGWAFHCDDPSYATGSQCFASAGTALCTLSTSGCPSSPRCVDGIAPLSVTDFCVDAGGAGAHVKIDCRVTGRSCQVGVEGCAGTPCAILLQTQCLDAKSAAVCRFGALVPLDCGPVGGTAHCETHGLVSYCTGPHDECSPYDPAPAAGQGVNSCDGTSIRLCVGGRMTSVDCRSAGADFACRTGSAPQSNYCGPPM